MNKIALCFMTKDRVELSKRTIEPLLGSGDIWWMDGSTTLEGEKLPDQIFGNGNSAWPYNIRWNVRGGPDAAVAYAVTECLRDKNQYTHVGIIENDVLLDPNWLDRTLALFDNPDGLVVGAASPRCYEDRVLFQRDGYNVMHNLGFGVVIWTREAAELMLRYMRTSLTTENRRVFMQLCGHDIGPHWAFALGEHYLCADWGVDRVLASHGLASVALDPSPVQMIGQTPPLAEQGLILATGRKLPNTASDFDRFVRTQQAVCERRLHIANSPFVYNPSRGWTVFAHHVEGFPEFVRNDKWRLKWQQGFGPFGYEATEAGAVLSMLISGPCGFLASGGAKGAQMRVRDLASGYECNPLLRAPHEGQSPIMSVTVPGDITSRVIEFEAMEPGAVFHGLVVEEPQPVNPMFRFDHSVLPPV